MYTPTEQIINELTGQGFVPYARRRAAGFRLAEMPAGYSWIIFWRTRGKTAFCHTRQTADKDDSRVLTDPMEFVDSVPISLKRDGTYEVLHV
jgi:hypothetical protein